MSVARQRVDNLSVEGLVKLAVNVLHTRGAAFKREEGQVSGPRQLYGHVRSLLKGGGRRSRV